MKFSTAAVHATLATVAASAAVELNRRATPLDVKLEMVGNSEVKATVTNNGDKDLNLFIRNSFLDGAPIEKAEVYGADSRVTFDGIRQRTNIKDLDNDSFTNIPAGQSIEANFDVAEMHDLSNGGDFDILTQGAIPYAEGNSTKIVGAVPYLSNRIKANVVGAHAAKVRRSFLGKIEQIKKRSTLTDCSGDKGTSTQTAMQNCQKLASAAADAATADNAAFTEFFKNADPAEVKKVLTAVAEECASTTSGAATYYCDENSVPSQFAVGGCQSQVLAYTMPSQSLVVNCDLYYSALPALTDTCYDQDQATTTLHEFTHLSEIKGTDDLGYGYSAATQLSGSQALNNADSYALFANAVANNCAGGSGSSSSTGGGSSSSDSSTGGSSSSGGSSTGSGSGTATTPSAGSGSGSGTGTGSGIGGIFTPISGGSGGSGFGSGSPFGNGSGSGSSGSGSGSFPPNFTPGSGSGSGSSTGTGSFPPIFTPGSGSSSGLGGLGGLSGTGAGSSSESSSDSSSSSSPFGGLFSWPPSWLTSSNRVSKGDHFTFSD